MVDDHDFFNGPSNEAYAINEAADEDEDDAKGMESAFHHYESAGDKGDGEN